MSQRRLLLERRWGNVSKEKEEEEVGSVSKEKEKEEEQVGSDSKKGIIRMGSWMRVLLTRRSPWADWEQ